MCYTASEMSEKIKAKAIIGLTVSGYTAFKVSSYRPKTKIYIFSNSKRILRTLNLVWGVSGFYYDKFTTTDGTIEDTIAILKENKLIGPGDAVINTSSMPIEKRFTTNMIKVTIVE